jgi:hypothetical protein
MALMHLAKLYFAVATFVGCSALSTNLALADPQKGTKGKSVAVVSAAAPACAYSPGRSAGDVGRDPKTNPSHCAVNCANSLTIAPVPVVGNINQDLGVTFLVDRILGGPNQVCTSNGQVDWGDGTSTAMPSDPWMDCDKRPTSMLHDTLGKPVNVTLHHTYSTAGQYCVSARVYGNHKYDGNGSCSYDCTISNSDTVIIRDVPPLKRTTGTQTK